MRHWLSIPALHLSFAGKGKPFCKRVIELT
jgi:hypothetical protein